MGKVTNLSYSAEMVRSLSPDRFLLALFAPASEREAIFAVYALDAELKHVHHAVSEEMLGHIRYAWWMESIEALANGKAAREHPLLQQLAGSKIPIEKISALAARYQSEYPAMPDVDETVDAMARGMLPPEAMAGFDKALGIIARHRAAYGKRKTAWLQVKLMLAGVF